MIRSVERRVLFVHVQKTGGSSIERLLYDHLPAAEPVKGLPGGRHATMRQVTAALPETRDYWTFGFVRNPWARMYSWHAMVVRRGEVADAGNRQLAERIARSRFWGGVLARYPTFEQFVLEGPEEFERLRRPQLDYLRTRRRRADFIGRTENLDDDLREAFARIGIPLPPAVPQNNAGPPTDYREHYTPEMRRRVGSLFAADVDEFGYEF